MLPDLPYDMGNAGDLLKHGVLTEFVDQWAVSARGPLTFLDPFGGRPWQAPINPEVTRRLNGLKETALARSQTAPTERYLGSSMLVRSLAEALQVKAEILISDRQSEAREALMEQGFAELVCDGFRSEDAFTVLQCKKPADLILLDPFGSFLKDEAQRVIPQIGPAAARSTIVLFALDLDRCNWVGKRFCELKDQHLPHYMSLRCGKCAGTEVRTHKGLYEAACGG